jgi:signal transduction histidine kinase
MTIIDQQSAHLSQLIDDLLDVARLESGRFNIRREPVDIATQVDEVVKSMTALAEEKKIAVTKAIPENLPPVEADPQKFKQVVRNLLSNAIKFSQNGKVVTISAEPAPGEIVIRVRDNGVGISNRAQAHLFERFYRAEDSLTRQTGGTGLGLYIVKQIVEAHGGRVWVESKVDIGSTLSFSLPLAAPRGGSPDDELVPVNKPDMKG